ncbi:MinD/ParA family ATP-binding protein [Mycolicibacterium houstonense]|uniref:MinD/ParA family ATP-binding protein n=1 Tax=Mycolicibacterium houstonense TaxID=146021 RepID=UPI000AA0CCE7|nr:AAA family ATPase [Mycolicibacterium houstonense]
MSERDIFEQMGASTPSDGTSHTSNYPPPQHNQQEFGDAAHRRQAPPPPVNSAPPNHVPSGPDAPTSVPPRSGEPTPSEPAGHSPDTAAARYDDLTQEITPQQLREARDYAAQQRQTPAAPFPPQPPQVPGQPWRAAPPGTQRRDQPFSQQNPYQGGPRDGGLGFISAAGSGELLGDQVRATDLVAVKKIPSSRGWRKWLYKVTFGAVNTGESPDEQRVRAMREQIAAPMGGTLRIAVIGGKGGAGKTSAAVAIGSEIAVHRAHEHVIAVDADPAQGANLAVRIDRAAPSSYAEIIAAQNIVRYSDMRARVGHNAAGLDVLASPYHRGAASQAGGVTAEGYQRALTKLENFYNVVVTDCGVDIGHPVMDGVLSSANAVVMVASAVPDGAEGAAKQIDWLSHHPRHRKLLDRMVLIVNHIRPASSGSDRKSTASLVEIIQERFGRWIPPERIFVVPYDGHIATAGVVELDELQPLTRRRILEVTAAIASGFTTVAEAS